VPLLYRDAARLDWQHITDAERSRQYAAWLADEDVGAPLIGLLGREGARVWMKDGPLKEYSRALAGVGVYARYADQASVGPDALVEAALGDEWRVVADSFGIKPLHCLVEREDERTYVAWGPARDFKHLIWACLRALDANTASAKVVVLESVERPTPYAARNFHHRIARRCGLEALHLNQGRGHG